MISFLGNFYRHLVTFYWSCCSGYLQYFFINFSRLTRKRSPVLDSATGIASRWSRSISISTTSSSTKELFRVSRKIRPSRLVKQFTRRSSGRLVQKKLTPLIIFKMMYNEDLFLKKGQYRPFSFFRLFNTVDRKHSI